MDRPIRPQFPEWFYDEVQVQSFVLASDRQNDGDILAMNGASAALTISPLPFQGPLGSVRLAYINGEFVVFPTHDQLEESDLDLIVSGSRDAILMIEGFARELPESLMTQAIAKAHEHIREICELQIELAQKVNVVKAVYPPATPNPFMEVIRSKYFEEIKQAKRTEGKQARAEAVSALKERVKAELIPAAETEDKALEEKFCCGLAVPGCPGHSRIDSLGHALRRPRQQDVAADQLLGRRVAPRPWFGRLPARRDAGHGHRHARHRQGRAAGGRPGRRVRPEVHAALLLPVVFGGRSAAHPRPWPPRDRSRRPGRAERQARPAPGRGLPLYDPHHFRHPGVERLQFDGHGLRFDAGTDGRRRADQQPGCRHLDRPG